MEIKIALPSKGRISDPAVKLLSKAGIGLKDTVNRRLFSATFDQQINVMFTRPLIFLNSLLMVLLTWE
jgi:ATP phosphoribosyltransferase